MENEIDISKYSPMMQHYLRMKKENPDAILMYRLGDFYEMFFEDAKICSRELDLVLTAKAAGAEKAPMCGVPHHSVNSYISRLIKKGYKVAVCEQLSDPASSKGLVERGIVRIVTPGTYMEEIENQKQSNYLCALHTNSYKACLVFCDVSTGVLKYEITDRSLEEVRKSLSEMEVRELVADKSVGKLWNTVLSQSEDFVYSVQKAIPLRTQDERLLPYKEPLLQETMELLLGYLLKTQMKPMEHLHPAEPLRTPSRMVMDPETKAHLELVRSNSSFTKAKSLWEFMDLCQTSPGSRLLREWVEAPLVKEDEICRRQDAVQVLLDHFLVREQLKDHLCFIYDMERLSSRISYGNASPRDVLQLISSLEHAAPIIELANVLESYPELQTLDLCQDLYGEIYQAIVPDPPVSFKEGNVIAKGYSKELDEIRKLAEQGSQAMLDMEARERERSGIKNLKIGYNRVFGYYIEIRNSNLSQVKEELGYIPKQTLASATRYITQELKDLETRILQAHENKISLEQELFKEIIGKIQNRLKELQALSRGISLIDVLSALAALASEKGYVRPTFNQQSRVLIHEGKHPILEEKISGYVSNDWTMTSDKHIQLITGPNMGGKSTYLRQNALLVIMAQMGSFIPAKSACLPIFDRIFTRIGASDDLLTGKSTFMVEMMEANIALRYATDHSLILFDEIGRGTATYDGMSLAQAIIEYIEQAIQAKTLFSTHYHELTALEQEREGIENVHVDVREKKNEIQFMYRVLPGKADKSYGIHVARLASLPPLVLERAQILLEEYENSGGMQDYQPSLFVLEKPNPAQSVLLEKLDKLDVDALSPREALQCLYEIKELALQIKTNN